MTPPHQDAEDDGSRIIGRGPVALPSSPSRAEERPTLHESGSAHLPPSGAPATGSSSPQPTGSDAPGPQPAPRMIWGHGTPGLHTIGVWTERVPGRGEDAEPLLAYHLTTHRGLIGVFDGSGGSGSSPAWQAQDGEQRTGAWVGARVARLAMDCWFQEVTTAREAADAENLKGYLDFFHERAPKRRSKIVGRMRRQLPTTLAAIEFSLPPEGQLEGLALWAGDSRAYLLDPEAGLQVLTRDHTEVSDALELLRSDPPMTNTVSADRDFYVQEHSFKFPLPCVLLTATDGFYGYVHTPADFENTLLSTLRHANCETEWADLIRRSVQVYTADDASLGLIALGYKDFACLRDAFAARQQFIAGFCRKNRPTHTDPASAVRAWQDDTWHGYRTGYEAYLPAPQEEQA
ncbi:serine/threonine protein phosphatase [Streptomyces sp. Isolate_45]|uniref:serine/threonine protein phosphatase n=1 Tax=Streptomyces sp. Isolate_45 TaxID=2950111 RepID=UPI002481E652|nr:serine/threonine protein phosphatase [Streptomyces sp. Isolate_45]MDA5284185.1 serine/threonine protein phosphatase [Streptomyces sp. Isolate_45]